MYLYYYFRMAKRKISQVPMPETFPGHLNEDILADHDKDKIKKLEDRFTAPLDQPNVSKPLPIEEQGLSVGCIIIR